jgi:hypothetical protein
LVPILEKESEYFYILHALLPAFKKDGFYGR